MPCPGGPKWQQHTRSLTQDVASLFEHHPPGQLTDLSNPAGTRPSQQPALEARPTAQLWGWSPGEGGEQPLAVSQLCHLGSQAGTDRKPCKASYIHPWLHNPSPHSNIQPAPMAFWPPRAHLRGQVSSPKASSEACWPPAPSLSSYSREGGTGCHTHPPWAKMEGKTAAIGNFPPSFPTFKDL